MSKSPILFLTRENPFPPAGGAHIRDASLIQILKDSFDIEILCQIPLDSRGKLDTLAVQIGDESTPPGIRVHRVHRDPPPLWERVVSPLRPFVKNNHSHRIEQALKERAHPGKVLWISRLEMAKYAELAKSLGYRILLDLHQVETRNLLNSAIQSATQFSTFTRGLNEFSMTAQCSRFEAQACSLANAVIAASDLDASRIQRLAPQTSPFVIPHSIDCSQYSPIRHLKGGKILFSGALNYEPNREGLAWFVHDVLPRLRSQLGLECPSLCIAGSNPSPEIFELAKKANAEMVPDPASLLPYLAEAAVVIIPARSGRRMRFKILEAMASGRAVISTPRGAEGLLLSPGYDVWISDTADGFASALSILFRDTALRDTMAEKASQTADRRYDSTATRSLLASLIDQIESLQKSPQETVTSETP